MFGFEAIKLWDKAAMIAEMKVGQDFLYNYSFSKQGQDVTTKSDVLF